MPVRRRSPLSPLALPLTDAYGCVAAEDIVASISLPEFASSGMDGFAVRRVGEADKSWQAWYETGFILDARPDLVFVKQDHGRAN